MYMDDQSLHIGIVGTALHSKDTDISQRLSQFFDKLMIEGKKGIFRAIQSCLIINIMKIFILPISMEKNQYVISNKIPVDYFEEFINLL